MKMAHPRAVAAPVSGPSAPVGQVQCDLCEAPMFVPRHSIMQGRIFGLLTCSQCVEDALAARQLELQP